MRIIIFLKPACLRFFFKETAVDGDLHDIMDIVVIFDIMNPWPRKSLMTGLSWYEINPTLYRDKTFFHDRMRY